MKLYIASSLNNVERIKQLRDEFVSAGIHITYDWTSHGYVTDEEALAQIAVNEYNGVKSAACLLMVLPARIGSHFEFGVAYSSGIPVVILEEEKSERMLAFYKLPSVYITDNKDDAFQRVIEVLKYNVI
jgi:hypothetical protein